MPRILLTRPQPESEGLARQLNALGYQTMIEPLLRIVPVTSPPPDFQNLQAVIATSAHAFDFFDRKNLLHLPCYCVGTSTARAARQAGFATVHDTNGDGTALAQHITKELDARHGALLHLAGRDTDARMGDVVQAAGFTIRAWVLYAAEAADCLSDTAQALFREGGVDAVLLFSTRTAQILCSLLQKHGLEDSCKNVIALGISSAVMQGLDSLPWLRADSATHPTEDAVVQSLKTLLPVS